MGWGETEASQQPLTKADLVSVESGELEGGLHGPAPGPAMADDMPLQAVGREKLMPAGQESTRSAELPCWTRVPAPSPCRRPLLAGSLMLWQT